MKKPPTKTTPVAAPAAETTAPEVVKLKDVLKEFKIALETLERIVEESKTKPVYETKYGLGTMKLYNKADVAAVVKKFRERQAAEAEAKKAQKKAAPTKAAEHQQSAPWIALIEENAKAVSVLQQTVSEIGVQQTVMQRTLEKMIASQTAQSDLLKSFLEKMAANDSKVVKDLMVNLELILAGVSELTKELGVGQALKATASPAPVPPAPSALVPVAAPVVHKAAPVPSKKTIAAAAAAEVIKEAAATKRMDVKVMIVGLIGSQAQMIHREYGKRLTIKCVESNKAKGSSFRTNATNSDVVIAMTSFINHGVEDVVKGGVGRLIRIDGGITKLRDALDEILEKGPIDALKTAALTAVAN